MKKLTFNSKVIMVLTLFFVIPLSVTTIFFSGSILRNTEEEIGEFNAQYLKSMSQSIEVMVDALVETAMHTTLSDKINQLDFICEREQITDGKEAVACLCL